MIFLARAPNEKVDKAKKLYLKGEKLIDIANELEFPEGTVRRWKKTYQWDSERSEKNSERSVKTSVKKKKTVAKEVKQVMENTELTDKQRLFCLHYIKCFNATKAYQKAYECSYEVAASASYRMLDNVGIRNEIQHLKQNRYQREFLSEADIFQKYMDIAFADITDFLDFGTEEVPVMALYGPVKIKDPETGEEKTLTKTVNVVHFKPSSEVDGSILAEVKQGKDGASIKLADRMKALEWLSKHMNIATDEQKARIEQIHAQTELLKAKAQADDVEEAADDGFIEALKGTAADDWEDGPDEEN
nr:MAG TPA: Terminase small subunit [Caudoviricetes sp.]